MVVKYSALEPRILHTRWLTHSLTHSIIYMDLAASCSNAKIFATQLNTNARDTDENENNDDKMLLQTSLSFSGLELCFIAHVEWLSCSNVVMMFCFFFLWNMKTTYTTSCYELVVLRLRHQY